MVIDYLTVIFHVAIHKHEVQEVHSLLFSV